MNPVVLMWATYAFAIGALVVYATESFPMEVVSIGVVSGLLILFTVFPLYDEAGTNVLNAARLLEGFANPALITVMALLVMGQGMVRAGVLDLVAQSVLRVGVGRRWIAVLLVLIVAMSVSAFLNNIPVVVIFIPIMQGLATRLGISPSKLMIPLSYAAVVGGMTTLVGSSTNLLVNSALIQLDVKPFGFFDFSVPGLVMAATGLAYLLIAAPGLLRSRARLAETLMAGGGRQFIAQLTIAPGSALIGKGAPGGLFSSLPDMTLRMVQRGEEAVLPPFENFVARSGDVLVVAATRRALTEALGRGSARLQADIDTSRDNGKAKSRDDGSLPWSPDSQMVAEVMVTPASRYEGQTLRQIGFHHHTRCVVLGIQRRARMIRTRMTEIRLEAGDVLLVQGRAADVNELKANRDVILIEWSAEELATTSHAWIATTIFVMAIGLSAAGVIPLVVTTLAGAVAMVASGVLNIRQATRAVDPRIVATIGAALALGVSLQETGGAHYLAGALVDALHGASPATVLSLFFLAVAVLSNIVTTKTAAVLFTPIAVDIASEIGVAPEPFALAVVFAANCSFASPLGYQTNLLVLGPGHYRFMDFVRAGSPLIILLWIAFTLFVPGWYGL